MTSLAMALRAFGNRLVVRQDTPETASPGGIVLPETSGNRPSSGTVVSAGPLVNKDAKCDADKVEAGSRIYFNPYAGQAVKYDGTEYLVISSDEVFAFIGPA